MSVARAVSRATRLDSTLTILTSVPTIMHNRFTPELTSVPTSMHNRFTPEFLSASKMARTLFMCYEASLLPCIKILIDSDPGHRVKSVM